MGFYRNELRRSGDNQAVVERAVNCHAIWVAGLAGDQKETEGYRTQDRI
jgi:hypothetical protein